CRASTWEAAALFLLARVESRTEDAFAHLAAALRISREFNCAQLVRAEAARAPDLFQLAITRDIAAGYLTSLGLESEAATDAAASQAAEAATPAKPSTRPLAQPVPAEREIDLMIKMLGPVEVLREQGRRLAPDAWTLSRALRILCFIASRHNHRATKDSIVE